MRAEYNMRILPLIKDMKAPIKNIQEAYISLAEDEINCENFRKVLVESSQKIKSITENILSEAQDIYKKHPEEFKKIATPEGIAMLDELEHHKEEDNYDIVSNALLIYYKNLTPRKLKKVEKNLSKLIDSIIPENVVVASLKIIRDPDKKICVEDTAYEVLKIYGLKKEIFVGGLDESEQGNCK